jgi:hypothetical protein
MSKGFVFLTFLLIHIVKRKFSKIGMMQLAWLLLVLLSKTDCRLALSSPFSLALSFDQKNDLAER